MGNDKRNMKPQRKQKKSRQSGSVDRTIFKPVFISFAQGLNLKKGTLLVGQLTELL